MASSAAATEGTTPVTVSTSNRRHPATIPARPIGLALVALAGAAGVLLAASAPWALHAADKAGRVGEGAGFVLTMTVVVSLTVAVLAAACMRKPGSRRQVRVYPLTASALMFGGVLLSVLGTVATALAGDPAASTLWLSLALWLSIAAGAVFLTASLPIAD